MGDDSSRFGDAMLAVYNVDKSHDGHELTRQRIRLQVLLKR